MRQRIFLMSVLTLIFYIPLAFNIPATTGPIVRLIGDKWDWESSRLAGWNARNCGFVRFNADARRASKCVITSLRNHVPFKVRYETSSLDEAASTGLVRGLDGNFYLVSFLGGSPDGGVDLLRQRVMVRRCGAAIDLSKHAEGEQITCFASESSQ